MPTRNDREQLIFYMLGRDKPLDDEFDVGALAQRVLHGEHVRDVARAAAFAIDEKRRSAEDRKQWSKKRDIKGLLDECIVDEVTAFGLYHDGIVDQTAFELEPEILEELDEMLEQDDDDASAEATG